MGSSSAVVGRFHVAGIAALSGMLLAACSSSDGPSASASTSGVVVGSYFENAKVCIDANNNGACDASEAATYTDAQGRYTLPGTGAVLAEMGTNAFENDNGAHLAVSKAFTLRAPAEAPNVVSALSDRVVAAMKEGKDFTGAKSKVSGDTGIDADQLLVDFNPISGDSTAAAGAKVLAKALSDADLKTKDPGLGAKASANLQSKIKNVVVIYAENRSFDNLYGLFPGADGIANALKNPAGYQQVDRDGKTVLATLPDVWNKSAGDTTWDFVKSLPNKPFQINATQPGGAPGSNANAITPDLVHRFYNNQMQINGGKNNSFAAWADAGGLTMGYYDGSSMAMWKIAQQYTLADNFYMGAFGGSFLNHQWLVCACAPPWSGAAPAARQSKVNSDGVSLTTASTSPASALAGKPIYAGDFNITPQLADGKHYAINTTQPPFQPSGTPPADGNSLPLADATGGKGGAGSIPLPAVDSSVKTIGDTLTAKNIEWKWYAGAWNSALADGMKSPAEPRTVIYNAATGAADFQPHHQPFNYYSRFDPTTDSGSAERAKHLKDYDDLVADAHDGKLPPVAFYKPQGNLNQHPGYTDIMSGDAHIAEVIGKLQASPQWKNMMIVVTYDENGGFWDHAVPPKADQWGPGSRIPAIIISPYAKTKYIDHTAYDTTSILKFITKLFNLDALPGFATRTMIGDLTNALNLSP